jgi:ribA/ribD-fused uncharacterized protein
MKAENAIGPFKGEWAWLSNMYPCRVPLEGVVYSCTEIPYQAAKFPRGSSIRKNILSCPDGYAAKRMARGEKPRQDWDNVKKQVMRYLLKLKFDNNPELKEKLLATGDRPIVEYNTWNDTYWGVNISTGVGENVLGKLLIDLRRTYQHEEEVQ